MSDNERVVVQIFTTEMQAEIAKSALAAAEIPAVVVTDDAGGAYPQMQNMLGVKLLVWSPDEARAREILDQRALEEEES